jgi:hypothetical protein
MRLLRAFSGNARAFLTLALFLLARRLWSAAARTAPLKKTSSWPMVLLAVVLLRTAVLLFRLGNALLHAR